MGWTYGQPLGKNRAGFINPLAFEIRTDRRGLSTADEAASTLKAKRKGPPVIDVQGYSTIFVSFQCLFIFFLSSHCIMLGCQNGVFASNSSFLLLTLYLHNIIQCIFSQQFFCGMPIFWGQPLLVASSYYSKRILRSHPALTLISNPFLRTSHCKVMVHTTQNPFTEYWWRNDHSETN